MGTHLSFRLTRILAAIAAIAQKVEAAASVSRHQRQRIDRLALFADLYRQLPVAAAHPPDRSTGGNPLSQTRIQLVQPRKQRRPAAFMLDDDDIAIFAKRPGKGDHTCGRRHHLRSEEHTSELKSLMRISYAVFCLKKKIQT